MYPAIIPPGTAHVDSVVSGTSTASAQILAQFGANCSSLLVNFVARSTGVSDLRAAVISTLPCAEAKSHRQDAKDLANQIHARFKEVYEEKFAGLEKSKREGKLKKIIAEEIRIENDDQQIRELVVKMVELLQGIGILLIPHGELEDFDRSIMNSSDKNGWAREALTRRVFENDRVQRFCESIASAASNAIDNRAMESGSECE